MAAIDDFYLALVKRFKTVEITPTIAVKLDDKLWDGLAQGFEAKDVSATAPATLRETPGFEFRARPFVVFQLHTKNDKPAASILTSMKVQPVDEFTQ